MSFVLFLTRVMSKQSFHLTLLLDKAAVTSNEIYQLVKVSVSFSVLQAHVLCAGP